MSKGISRYTFTDMARPVYKDIGLSIILKINYESRIKWVHLLTEPVACKKARVDKRNIIRP